jgi:hypothetical protein
MPYSLPLHVEKVLGPVYSVQAPSTMRLSQSCGCLYKKTAHGS